MAVDTQYVIGFSLQVLGMLVIVGGSFLTARRMSKYDGDVTFDQLGDFLKTVGTELRSGFVIQAIGFIVAVAGMILQVQV